MQCEYFNCENNCTKLSKDQTIPCPHCNSKFYCSMDCRTLDWEVDHKYICTDAPPSPKPDNTNLEKGKLNFSRSASTNFKKKKSLRDYEIINQPEEEVGRGTYSKVKLVRSKENPQKLFAMKVISKEDLRQQKMIDNLKREVKIQKKLSHPNIIHLRSCFEDAANAYLILEHAENGSLRSYLNRKGKLDEKEAFKFFLHMCAGLDYLHRKGILHRDLKPENLLLDKDYNLLLSDFGWSVEDLEKRNTFCGTFDYMAPEIMQNQPHDYRVDIWSLGIILYELLHGHLPVREGEVPEEPSLETYAKNIKYGEISEDAKDLIVSLLKINPEERLDLPAILDHSWIKRQEQESNINIKDYLGSLSQDENVREKDVDQPKPREGGFSFGPLFAINYDEIPAINKLKSSPDTINAPKEDVSPQLPIEENDIVKKQKRERKPMGSLENQNIEVNTAITSMNNQFNSEIEKSPTSKFPQQDWQKKEKRGENTENIDPNDIIMSQEISLVKEALGMKSKRESSVPIETAFQSSSTIFQLPSVNELLKEREREDFEIEKICEKALEKENRAIDDAPSPIYIGGPKEDLTENMKVEDKAPVSPLVKDTASETTDRVTVMEEAIINRLDTLFKNDEGKTDGVEIGDVTIPNQGPSNSSDVQFRNVQQDKEVTISKTLKDEVDRVELNDAGKVLRSHVENSSEKEVKIEGDGTRKDYGTEISYKENKYTSPRHLDKISTETRNERVKTYSPSGARKVLENEFNYRVEYSDNRDPLGNSKDIQKDVKIEDKDYVERYQNEEYDQENLYVPISMSTLSTETKNERTKIYSPPITSKVVHRTKFETNDNETTVKKERFKQQQISHNLEQKDKLEDKFDETDHLKKNERLEHLLNRINKVSKVVENTAERRPHFGFGFDQKDNKPREEMLMSLQLDQDYLQDEYSRIKKHSFDETVISKKMVEDSEKFIDTIRPDRNRRKMSMEKVSETLALEKEQFVYKKSSSQSKAIINDENRLLEEHIPPPVYSTGFENERKVLLKKYKNKLNNIAHIYQPEETPDDLGPDDDEEEEEPQPRGAYVNIQRVEGIENDRYRNRLGLVEKETITKEEIVIEEPFGRRQVVRTVQKESEYSEVPHTSLKSDYKVLNKSVNDLRKKNEQLQSLLGDIDVESEQKTVSRPSIKTVKEKLKMELETVPITNGIFTEILKIIGCISRDEKEGNANRSRREKAQNASKLRR